MVNSIVWCGGHYGGTNGWTFLIAEDGSLKGGEKNLELVAKSGEVVRFYFTNTANTRVFNVALPGAQMKLVGADAGHYEHEELVEEVQEKALARLEAVSAGRGLMDGVDVTTDERGTEVMLLQRLEDAVGVAAAVLHDADDRGHRSDGGDDQREGEPAVVAQRRGAQDHARQAREHDAVDLDHQEAHGAGMVLDKVEE